jgi:hypothetical protein
VKIIFVKFIEEEFIITFDMIKGRSKMKNLKAFAKYSYLKKYRVINRIREKNKIE